MAADSRASTPFKRLGRVVYKRKKSVIVVWVVVLVLLVPVISEVGKYESLQMGTATGNDLESVAASNLISSQFARTVANSTLLVVVSSPNVTSVAAQTFLNDLVHSIKSDGGITGLNQTFDVYTPLYATIGSLNRAAYSAVEGGNSTSRLLFGVPALYLGAWTQSYSSTHNVTISDAMAYNYSAKTLFSTNETTYRLYSSHVLSLFDSAWTASWSYQTFAALNITARATMAARTGGYQYLEAYSPATKPFGETLLSSMTMDDYLSASRFASRLTSFAVGYVSNSSGFSQKLVGSSLSLGRSYGNASLYALAGSIVSKPSDYGIGRGLSTLVSSLVSPARDTTLVTLELNQSADANVVALRSDVSSVLASANSSSGIQSALVTGGDAISYDFMTSTQSDLSIILPVTIALLILATGLFFRSVLTPFLTLGTIGVALGISQVFIIVVGVLVAKADFTVPTILLTILIGVGTDYSVFVTARYREERVNGAPVQQAVETSVAWAGESIATSGATVIISFLALTLTSVVFLRTIGLVVGLGVLVALSIALTMVPALISVLGGRTFWPTSGERFAKYSASVLSKLQGKSGYFSRSGAFAVKRASVLIVLALVATAPAVYVYANTTPTFDFLSAAPANLDSIAASNHLTSTFGGGALFPTYVVMTFASPIVQGHAFNNSELATVQEASTYLASSPDIRNLTGPTMPYGSPIAYESINYSTSAGKEAFNSVMQNVGKDNRTVLLSLNFGIDPYSTQALTDTQTIRQALHSNFGQAQGVTGVYVGGASGGILDTKNIFDAQFNSVVPTVAVGVAVVLLFVLGSLFLPVFAVLSVLMSIVWTMAATKLVFGALYNFPILFITPFFLFVTLLGLGMDYNIFILTRIREEATKGKHLHDAIISAIEQTGGIITAAAVILAGSLGALMLSSDLFLRQLGFAFAYSILIDALVVRTYLVPAVMSKVGKWNWYNPIPLINRSRSLYERESPPPATT